MVTFSMTLASSKALKSRWQVPLCGWRSRKRDPGMLRWIVVTSDVRGNVAGLDDLVGRQVSFGLAARHERCAPAVSAPHAGPAFRRATRCPNVS